MRKILIVILFLAINAAFAISYSPPADRLPPICTVPDAQAWGILVQSGGVAGGAAVCSGDIGSTITADSYNSSEQTIFGLQITAGCTGDINSLKFYMPADDRSASFAMALYSDSTDTPGSMLATTAKTADPNAVQWHSIALSSSYEVTEGVKYWIMFWTDTDGGTNGQRVARTGTGQATKSSWSTVNGAVNVGSWPAGSEMTVEDREFGFAASYD